MATTDRNLTAQGQDRRDEIVREAERQFVENGFAKTRMVDIADAVGVTKGLLYWYFENKEALLAEVVVDMRSRLRTAQAGAMAGVENPLAQLYRGVVATIEFVLENQKIYGLINYSGFRGELGPALKDSVSVHAKDAAALIARAQEQGLVRTDDSAAELAHGNAGVVNNYCAVAATGHLRKTPAELGHLAARYIVRSLATSPEVADAIEAEHGLHAAGGAPRRGRARASGTS